MRGIAITLLSIALLAGCVGGPDDAAVETAGADDAPTAAPPSSSSSSTSPSAAGAKPAAASTPANATAAAPPEPVKVPYAWSSSIANEVCAPVAVLGCAGVLARDGWYDMPAANGVTKHAKLDLAWTASTGGIQEMRFVLVRASTCEGDGCWSGDAILSVVGPSPLTLDVDVPPLGEGEFLVVVVRAASMLPEPLFGFAHTEQSFDVSGEFLVQP